MRRPLVPMLLLLAAGCPAAMLAGACVSNDGVAGDDAAPGSDASGSADVDTSNADGAKPDASASADASREGGHCSKVTGECDLVLQDCPPDEGKPQECVVTQSLKTACAPVAASQQLPIGHACCTNGGANPCQSGLLCTGEPCADGGVPTGRCSPACCAGDDMGCGVSDPEGIAGACDVSIVDNARNELYRACSYRLKCEPFGVAPCKAGEACIVEDKAGNASCLATNGGGAGNRASCTYLNDCADGLVCVPTNADAGECRYACLTPSSNPPFDASAADGAPGQGGCPSGETCRLGFTNLPGWYQACAFPDGG